MTGGDGSPRRDGRAGGGGAADPGDDTGEARTRPAASPRDMLTLYRPDLAATLAEAQLPAYRYTQVYEHLMRRPGTPFSAATNLPLALREDLDRLGVSTLRLAARTDDADGTTKALLKGADGAEIEAVAMRYQRRSTVCVSTQVGCALGCAFCATGGMGFDRDLSPAEIVDQVRLLAAILADEERRVTNVVFMGMGEPLLNLDAVLTAIDLLGDQEGLGFARRSLSVSTIGIPAGIRRLAREEPQVNLALSLHAPDEALRTRLVPANKRFPLREVLAAADEHFALTHRKLFVEYVLLGGVNDLPRHATALAALLRGRVVTVNLIPWNPGCGDFSPPSPGSAVAFRDTLVERGIEATLRAGRGQAIAAGCGQLATRSRNRRGVRGRP